MREQRTEARDVGGGTAEDSTLLGGGLVQLEAAKNEKFVIIQYNVHSLINFEERMERLFHELDGKHWDIIVFF